MMNQIEKIRIFQNILSKYNVGDFLNKEDFLEVIYRLSFHPKWKKKKGVGIDKIRIDKIYGNKVFIIYRMDNSITDISFYQAAKGISPSTLQRIKSACRYSIKDIIKEKRKTVVFGIQKCEFTGDILYNDKNTHIDHYDLTFNQLFNLWMKKYDLEFLKKYLNNDDNDNVMEDWFTNNSIIKDFIIFHNKNTHLRAVSRKANLSIIKKQYKENV